jgi:hypothetical protein
MSHPIVYLDLSQFEADRPCMLLLIHRDTFSDVKLVKESTDLAITSIAKSMTITMIVPNSQFSTTH